MQLALRVYTTLALMSVGFPLGVCTAEEKAALQPKVKRVACSVPPAAVSKVGGFVGARLRANMAGYLRPFDIDRYVRIVQQKKHRDWWWIGEQPGKWLETAALAAEQSGDTALREKAQDVLARLVAAQEPGGYLGVTDPAVRTEKLPLRGMDAYELYFMMHGLLTAHELWDDEPAIAAARRLGDYFVDKVGPGKAEFWPRPKGKTIAGHEVHYSLEGTLLVDPMLRLYRATGDQKYLKWSRWVIDNIDRWSGHNTFSKLDRVADGTLGVHQLQPYVHAHTLHMNFLGFLRLYQVTGDESLLRKVRGAWHDIANRQMYITGGVSVGEHYEPGHNLPITGEVVETCATMSWIEVSQYLLELTADPVYADAIERLLWNHLFAAQTVDGEIFRYHTPLSGAKPAGYFHGPDCCTASGPRIASKIPMLLYAVGHGGLYVNQFVDSAAKIQLESGNIVSVTQETDYPSDEEIVITVSPRKPETFDLYVRLPDWCQRPSLRLDGEAIGGLKPGTYAKVRRQWKAGDAIVLSLPMRAQWEKGTSTTEGMWALRRGPVVYALDTVLWEVPILEALGDVPEDLSKVIGLVIDESHPNTEAKTADALFGALGPTCRVPIVLPNGRQAEVAAWPFANVGRWYRDAARKPDRAERRHAYTVWLPSKGSRLYSQNVKQYREKQELTGRTVDSVRPADRRSERGHAVLGEQTTTGRHQGKGWRLAADGGWFSYEMRVLPDQPMSLLCTWWGGESGQRIFDILIDRQRIATQKLLRNKPGEFFEVRYGIPLSLTYGKRKVTVRFQGHPGNTAGGLFACLMLEPGRSSLPAFPGAEGAGALTPGGRGGRVIQVTNLNDSGPGSLREAVDDSGPRIVVFRISGIITLQTPLAITNPYITIAGQTAPGDGICLRGQTTEINTHDVVIRYLRFRRGNLKVRNDALGGYPVRNIIVDHCSASWGLDENLSLYRHMQKIPAGNDKKMPVENVTIQWCISSEALDLNNHAFGATWGGRNGSFHHNLFACNTGRNPSIGWGDHVDLRNNVLFNWRHRTIDGGDGSSRVNVVANYFKPGPAVRDGEIRYRICRPQHLDMLSESPQPGKWYVAENVVVGDREVTADNWNGGVQFDEVRSETQLKSLRERVRASDPVPAPPIMQQTAEQAYQLVLANAGATLPKRDPVDVRIIESVRSGRPKTATGIIDTPADVGGWPEYITAAAPPDRDRDGMPDEWEQQFGLDPNDPWDGAKDKDADGYTNIEEHFNGTDPAQFVDYRKPENNTNTLHQPLR
ncbi:MAG: beta-L-arabinofuranosidase domain-containing protein [Planctomycetota bacterium]|jgi:DUF1680 family protein/pectate lyase